MVPVAVLIALLLLSDDPPLTRRTEDGGWQLRVAVAADVAVLVAVALLASGGAVLPRVRPAAVRRRRHRPGPERRGLAADRRRGRADRRRRRRLRDQRLAVDRGAHPPRHAARRRPRTPTETELYGLRISQLYAPRRDHRIPALAQLADDSTGAVVPSENGQQLGVIGALGLSLIVVVFVISALLRNATGWWSWADGAIAHRPRLPRPRVDAGGRHQLVLVAPVGHRAPGDPRLEPHLRRDRVLRAGRRRRRGRPAGGPLEHAAAGGGPVPRRRRRRRAAGRRAVRPDVARRPARLRRHPPPLRQRRGVLPGGGRPPPGRHAGVRAAPRAVPGGAAGRTAPPPTTRRAASSSNRSWRGASASSGVAIPSTRSPSRGARPRSG